jgi:signal transduction histidine kinase
VFRSLTAWRDPAAAGGGVSVTRLIDTVRALGLIIVFVTVWLAKPRPSLSGGVSTAIVVTLGLCVVAWVVWMLGDRWRPMLVAGLIAMGAVGGVLAGLSPNSPAVAVGCAATLSASVHFRTEASLGITAETVAAFLAAGLVTGASTGALLGYCFAFVGLWTTGLTRRKFLVRAEQAERMLAETRRARQAENQAAALAERARIARDIHDVLAHSLAAVSVNLQAAEGLLAADSLPAGNPELTKAIECIGRAAALTREGLVAARRAGPSVPRAGRPGRGVHGHRRGEAAVGTGQPGCVPDRAGGADERPQARARPAGHPQPRLRAGPGHRQRGQPAA